MLKRSTRVVKVTEIGQIYYEQVREVIHQLEQSNETVRSYQAKSMGQLRISSMVGFGERILLNLLEEFSQLYPEIILDVSLSDELSTLERDDVDLAIRGGYAPNQRVQAIRLMDNEFIPVTATITTQGYSHIFYVCPLVFHIDIHRFIHNGKNNRDIDNSSHKRATTR